MPNSDKLDEILQEFEHKRALSVPYTAAFAQARAQIIEWAMRIVGEDETEGRDSDFEGGDPAFDRNELRRELRRKLKGEA